MSLSEAILAGFGITQDDVRQFSSSNVGLHGVDVGRLSQFLLAQLTSACKHRTLNTFVVTDVIQNLEGVRSRPNAPKPRPFNGEALRGLWKVHFVDASFLLQNILNEWSLPSDRSRKFEELCRRVARDEASNPSPHGWQGRLAHELVIGGYRRRAAKQRLTGEWLVFGIHEQKNVYLALCSHTNSPEEDSALYEDLLRLCGEEFPDVFIAGGG